MEGKKKELLSQLLGGAALLGYAVYRQHPGRSKSDKGLDPSIARPGEQVVALEDSPGEGLTYDIHKGARYTVKSYHLGAYTFQECPPEYDPYLGEEATRWFDAKNFRRLTPEDEPDG